MKKNKNFKTPDDNERVLFLICAYSAITSAITTLFVYGLLDVLK